MENTKKTINPILLMIGFVGGAVIIILIYILAQVLRTNPYGDEIRIDNFGSYFADVPQETKDTLFASLYGVVKENLAEEATIPSNGALIRGGSATYEYNETTNVHQGRFIVDISAVKQSYGGYFEWSNNEDNIYLSGYASMYSCLKDSELIYGDFGCKNMFTDMVTTEYPILEDLPLKVEYYANNYSEYTSYYLTFEKLDDGICLVIEDYSGGNYEKALNKIRELGYNPDDYEINYLDKTGEYLGGWAGEN